MNESNPGSVVNEAAPVSAVPTPRTMDWSKRKHPEPSGAPLPPPVAVIRPLTWKQAYLSASAVAHTLAAMLFVQDAGQRVLVEKLLQSFVPERLTEDDMIPESLPRGGAHHRKSPGRPPQVSCWSREIGPDGTADKDSHINHRSLREACTFLGMSYSALYTALNTTARFVDLGDGLTAARVVPPAKKGKSWYVGITVLDDDAHGALSSVDPVPAGGARSGDPGAQ